MGRRSGKRRVPVRRRAEGAERVPGPQENVPVLPSQLIADAASSRGSRASASRPVPVSAPDRDRVTAAYSRSPVAHRSASTRTNPRPRVEVSFNELTGMMSWRTIQPPETGPAGRPGNRNARGRAVAGPPGLRTTNSHGAAPIPTNPADVRAAVNVSVASLPPERLRRHLAVVAALRSRVAADAVVGAKLPSTVAAHVRSAATPAAVHALNEERADTNRELRRRAPAVPAQARAAAPARGRHH